MLGLLMKKEYILDVLNKRTSFDARLYDSDVRGKIGLIESGTNKLYGYVNMVDVHQITYEDYVKWHISDNYDLDLVALKLQNNNMIKRNAYAYDFENQVLLSAPTIVNLSHVSKIWVEFDPNNSNKGFVQESLF